MLYKLVGVWCPTVVSRFCTGEVPGCQTNEDSLGERAEEKRASWFVPQGERVCKRVGGQDNTENLLRKKQTE